VGELLVGVPWHSSRVDLQHEVSVDTSGRAPLDSELSSVSQDDGEHLAILVWEGWSALGPRLESPVLLSRVVVALPLDDGRVDSGV